MAADHSAEVYHADQLREDGDITWDQYADLLRGKFNVSMAKYTTEMARGYRDRQGRRKDLKDLGGRPKSS